jgi:hypothetical protein
MLQRITPLLSVANVILAGKREKLVGGVAGSLLSYLEIFVKATILHQVSTKELDIPDIYW